jgi:hypothetical protein
MLLSRSMERDSRRGFRLDIGFIDHLYTQLGTTSFSSLSSPAVSWQRLLTVEILQLHMLKSSPNDGSLATASFPNRLRYRTDLVAPIVFLITPLHGPSRKRRFQQYHCCCMRIRCRENVSTEPLPRNGSTCYNIKTDLTEKRNVWTGSFGFGYRSVTGPGDRNNEPSGSVSGWGFRE